MIDVNQTKGHFSNPIEVLGTLISGIILYRFGNLVVIISIKIIGNSPAKKLIHTQI